VRRLRRRWPHRAAPDQQPGQKAPRKRHESAQRRLEPASSRCRVRGAFPAPFEPPKKHRGKPACGRKFCILDPLAGSSCGVIAQACQNGSFDGWATCEAASKFGPDSLTKRPQNGHSSPGVAVSVGPSAIDRRNSATHSSVRSHRAVHSRPNEPRRHHCRPDGTLWSLWRASAATAGRRPSLGVAVQSTWLVREAPDPSLRAGQSAPGGAVRRSSALRPCAAAF
jgi:hypothetical protein